MNFKLRIKTFDERKKERDVDKQKREKSIQNVLDSAQNNPKFTRLLNFSLNSIDNLISPLNREFRLNAKMLIQKGASEILKEVALKNKDKEEVVNHISDILWKLTSLYDNIDKELAKNFVDANGHKSIMDLLIKKQKGYASFSLFKTLNGLIKVPHLMNRLLESGLIDTFKQTNDIYFDDLNIIDLNFDTLLKISNSKNGREYIIKKEMCPYILKNIQICSEKYDVNGVATGLEILNNICRSDEGMKILKEANAHLILCQVVDKFNGNEKIVNKAAKIFAKLFTKEDFETEFQNFKNAKSKFETENNIDNITECKNSLSLIANMVLVEDLAKLLSKIENFDELVALFNKFCDIDLNEKPSNYIKEYINVMKHFMNEFKRVFDQAPDYLDEKTKNGSDYKDLIKKITNCIKKNWENTKLNVENLEKEKNNEADQIKTAFQGFFTAYAEILNKINNFKSEEEKKNEEWKEILDYVTGEVIANSSQYLKNDELPNFAASKILKIVNDATIKNPETFSNNLTNLKKCIPYIKNVIDFSNNWKTLSNDLDVVQNVFKTKNENDLEKEIIPTIANFMNEKPKFRTPNLTNLNILNDFLTPEIITDYQQKINNPQNNIFGVDYVDVINSVMANPNKSDTNNDRNLDESLDEDIIEESGELEPKNDETEKNIIIKGSELLKKLITLEDFLKAVKEFKNLSNTFNPEKSNKESAQKLNKSLVYQNCALNVKEFFEKGMLDDFIAVRDLIKKEIDYIEGYKRIKANENDPHYQEICNNSNKRLKFCLGTLRILEDQAIETYKQNKDENCKNLIKDISELNNEIIDKSNDSSNLIEHLIQLKKNIPFIRDKEEILDKNKNGKYISECCVNSLMNIFRKMINNDDLNDLIIKNLIGFTDNKKNVCDNLVKSGCPKLLMQILENTYNNQLAKDAVELLDMLISSSDENAVIIGNQNILIKLFEIRSKFANSEEITKKLDHIANEIMKSPDQAKYAQGLIKEAVQEFHDNVNKNFDEEIVKQKILNNVEIINLITSNKKVIEPILRSQFIDDLSKAVDLTIKSQETSQIIDKLLTNEMVLVKKIKDNLINLIMKEDPKHYNLIDDTMKVILEKPNFIDSLIISCKCLLGYIIDDELYDKHTSKLINDNFIDKLFAIQEDNLDNPEVIKEINNILCYLAIKNPNHANYIMKKGGLVNIINEIKSVSNLNDPESQSLKINGLKMLNSLLNYDENLDSFIKANGLDLINKLVKSEINQSPSSKKELFEEENFFTNSTICINTPEQLKEYTKSGKFPYPELTENSNDVEKKSKQIMKDLMSDDKNNNDENSDNSDNSCIQCLKIINKGLNKDKKEFADDNIISNLTNLAQISFPNKFLFNEVASFLSNKNVNIPNDPKINENLLKSCLSNKALFYNDNLVKQRVQNIENKIAQMLKNDKNYKTKFIKILEDKDINNQQKNKLLTFSSLLTDKQDPLKDMLDEAKPQLCNFFNDMLNTYKPITEKILTAKKSGKAFNINSLNYNEKYDEGVVLSLIKLYNYLIENGIIDPNDPKNLEYIKQLNLLAVPLYRPDNYIFVDEFEKETEKIDNKIGKYENGKEPEEYSEIVMPTQTYLDHLDECFPKAAFFLEDFHNEMKSLPQGEYKNINKQKEDNFDKILTFSDEYFKSEEGDSKVKNEQCKKLKDPVNNLLYDFTEKLKNKSLDEEVKNDLDKKMDKLWGLMGEIIKNDKDNYIINTKEPSRVKEMINKINNMIKENINIKKQGKVRFIPLNISRKCCTDEYVNNGLIDFVKEDFQNMKTNEEDAIEIKYIDLEILANVSKHPGSMIEIMKSDNLLNVIKAELINPNLTIKQRGIISELIHNATKSNYEIQNILKKNPELMSLILKKILNDPVKTLEKDQKQIAQNDIDTLYNILKDDNNIKTLNELKLLDENDLKNLVNAYDKLDPKLTEPLKPILNNLEQINNNKKEITTAEDDEFDLKEITRKVTTCYKVHRDTLLKMGTKSNEIVQCSFNQGELYRGSRPKIADENEEEENENENDDVPEMPVLERASSIHQKKLSYVTGTLLFNPLNTKIKSKLDTNENEEMSTDLDKILATLRKNYDDLKQFKGENPELDQKKIDNCLTCLSLLKKIALAPDNHKPILERGFMNWIDNFNDDFKLINKDDTPNIDSIEFPIMVEAKDVLQACSNSEDAKPFIRDSNVLMDIIGELNILYDKPDLVKSNDNIGKCFLYDNVIFSNLCKDKKGLDVILGQLGLEKLMSFGQKTGNSNLLEGILSMLINYVKNAQNKDDIPQDIIDSVFEILDKCMNLKVGKTPQIMSKCLILGGLLYSSKHAPKVDNIDLIKNMNDDIDLYKEDENYVNTCLNTLYILANKPNLQKALDIGLLKKLNDLVLKTKNELENQQNEENENLDTNTNLKNIYNLTKIYNKLADVDPINVQKFNSMGISNNSINFMNKFNEIIQPMSEEEKRSRIRQNLYNDNKKDKEDESLNVENDNKLNEEKKEEEGDFKDDDKDVNTKSKNELIRGIMGNSMNVMKKVTADPNNNEYIANETPFSDTLLKTLDNKNNDKTFISSGLHALENYLKTEKGKNFENLDLNKLYNLLKNLQMYYYSDPNIMQTINNISSSLVQNLKDDKKGFIIKFFNLLNDSIKIQDKNAEFILPSLKQMYDCLTKKPFLENQVGEEIIPNILNLLSKYTDNLEIQEQCYKILELLSKNSKFCSLMMNKKLIGFVKETLKNQQLNDEIIKNGGHPVKESILNLLNNLLTDKSNCQLISDELCEFLNKEIETKGYNQETKNVINILDKLLKNESCIQNFVLNNGIENIIHLLEKNAENDELVVKLFQMLKNVVNNNDEYKQMMVEKKVPDLINTVIVKVAPKNKNIELQGRTLIFLINSFKVKLEDPNSILVNEIKLEEPIPPEVRNFLTNGRQVNIINNNGDTKPVQLIFNYDLKKVMARKMKSNLPPKPKYIIDVPLIKKLIKGHGSDAFKNSAGLFRKAPSPELCFTIIGPTTIEGTKMLNVVCESEKDVDRWIKYIEIVLNYFKKNKTIKTAVVIKKKIEK